MMILPISAITTMGGFYYMLLLTTTCGLVSRELNILDGVLVSLKTFMP